MLEEMFGLAVFAVCLPLRCDRHPESASCQLDVRYCRMRADGNDSKKSCVIRSIPAGESGPQLHSWKRLALSQRYLCERNQPKHTQPVDFRVFEDLDKPPDLSARFLEHDQSGKPW